MKAFAVGFSLGSLLMAQAAKPTKPADIVLHERHHPQQQVCAEYTVASAPREPNRSCVDIGTVREWVLRNARPEECH